MAGRADPGVPAASSPTQGPPWPRRSLFCHVCQPRAPPYSESPAEGNWELVKGSEQGRDHGRMSFRKANLTRCFIHFVGSTTSRISGGLSHSFPDSGASPSGSSCHNLLFFPLSSDHSFRQNRHNTLPHNHLSLANLTS